MSMINVCDASGKQHLINTKHIVRISEASPSSQWHGVRAVLKMSDGITLECTDTVKNIKSMIDSACHFDDEG